MYKKTDAIGVIDSGIGGFSVARKVQEILPHENLIYFGDGFNTPYGNHTADEILTMTRYMLKFMKEKNVKALLVACNTISCLIESYRGDMEGCTVLSVVEAGSYAVQERQLKKVGIISTCFTANSKCYPDLLAKIAPTTEVISHGCPDLANLVERYVGIPEGQELIENDLKLNLDSLVNEEKVEQVVLGCTHYPLVSDTIHRLYPDLTLIDPAVQMAYFLKSYLERNELANTNSELGNLDIFTTGSVPEYAMKANKVGLNPITSIQHVPPYIL